MADVMKIEKIRLKNFKGIKEFELELNGSNVDIFGPNRIGKSTIFDSFWWLLFGKNAFDKADFDLKPTDGHGNEIHNLDTEVEYHFLINGEKLSLLRRLKEKWTKPRGKAVEEYTGNVTEYFINDVPAKKKEYDPKVESIANINLFKILTSPFEFNNIGWQERRNILFEISGDIEPLEVAEAMFPSISQKDDYRVMASIIDSGIDDHMKKINGTKKLLKSELKGVPHRIDELNTSIKDIAKPDLDKKNELQFQLSEVKNQINSLENNTAISEKQIRINEIDSEILTLKNSDTESPKKKNELSNRLSKIEHDIRLISQRKNETESALATENNRLNISMDAIESVRNEWHKINDKPFSMDDKCPTCGQFIPEDQILDAENKFNISKSEQLEEITKKGKEQGSSIEARKKTISEYEKELIENDAVLKALKQNQESLNKEIAGIKPEVDTEAIATLEKEKTTIREEITAIESGNDDEVKTLLGKQSEFNKSLNEILVQEAAVKAGEESKKRIEKLEEKEKRLIQQLEEIERDIFFIEQFTVKKCDMLEDRINGMFKLAKFKLFEKQKNGGINDKICRTIFNGVGFNRGCSNSEKINIGLDIINTLSNFYGFKFPIFIDNAESCTDYIETLDTQVIKLIVSKEHTEITPIIVQ